MGLSRRKVSFVLACGAAVATLNLLFQSFRFGEDLYTVTRIQNDNDEANLRTEQDFGRGNNAQRTASNTEDVHKENSGDGAAIPSDPDTFDALPPHWINPKTGLYLHDMDTEMTQPVVHWDWHPLKRSDRFPSIEERVKWYMGNWYLPPCTGSGENERDERLLYQFDYSGNATFPDVKLYNVPETIFKGNIMTEEQKLVNVTTPSFINNKLKARVLWNETIWNDNGIKTCLNLLPMAWCEDMRLMSSVVEEIKDTKHLEDIPVILGYTGDKFISRDLATLAIPYFVKARHATTLKGLNNITLENNRRCNKERGWIRKGLDIPSHGLRGERAKIQNAHYHGIIWPFKLRRHFDVRRFRDVIKGDVPWEKKLDSAVWRGTYTSFDGECLRNGKKINTFDDECDCNVRCQMVRKNWNSSIANVGILRKGEKIPYHLVAGKNMTLDGLLPAGHIPDHFVGEKMSVEEQLKHKAIISIEGNDVSSGVKWMLFSGSVVIMPKPKITSYAMEEMLEPWVHFVPIENPDFSDLEDKVEWVLENDKKAQIIAERGKLFIADFLFHHDAPTDNKEIKRRIMERYFKFFKEPVKQSQPPHF